METKFQKTIKTITLNRHSYIEIVAQVIIFLIFALLLARINAAYFSYILILTAVFLFGETVYYKRFLPNIGRINPYLGLSFITLFGGFIVAQLINHDAAGAFIVIKWLCYGLSMWVVWYICSSYSYQKPFEYGIYMGAFVASILAIFELMSNPDLLFNIKGVYGHHNTLGAMMMLVIPVLFSLIVSKEDKRFKFCGIIILGMSIISLIISGSRGAMISLVIATLIGILVWSLGKNKVNMKILIALLLIIMACAFGLYQTQINKSNESHLGGERNLMVISSLSMWNDHKLAGVGVSHWQENYNEKYHLPESQERGLTYDHNIVTFSLSTSGVIGLLGYLGSCIMAIIGFYKTYEKTNNKTLVFGLFISFLAFLLHCQVNPDLQNNTIPRFYFALIGITMAEYAASLKRLNS